MLEVESSGQFGPDLEALPFDMKVRYCRLQVKISAEFMGILYAQAIGREKPYTGRRIEQMELHDDFPEEKTRRWAIAKIVQMNLFFKLSVLGIDLSLPESKPAILHQPKAIEFDIGSYQVALQKEWTQPFQVTLEDAKNAIMDRIYKIHEKVSYLSNKQKVQAWRTLCCHHIILASDIYGAQNDAQGMVKQTKLAMLLAKENGYPDLYAIALLQHGVFCMDQGDFSVALRDFEFAQHIKLIPQQLRGKILASAGRAKARIAHTQTEMEDALKYLDEAEHAIDKDSLEDFGFLVAFGEDKYKLERGEALIGSPLSHLRSPAKALSYLPGIYRVDEVLDKELFRTIGHRQAHNHILQAEISILQKQYPIAVALAEEALAFAVGVQSNVHLKKLLCVCNLLKASSYANNLEVSMLEIGVRQNLQPELFN